MAVSGPVERARHNEIGQGIGISRITGRDVTTDHILCRHALGAGRLARLRIVAAQTFKNEAADGRGIGCVVSGRRVQQESN
jgi:hypothetical protein